MAYIDKETQKALIKHHAHIKSEYSDYMKDSPPGDAQNFAVKEFVVKKLKALRKKQDPNMFMSIFEVGMGYGLCAEWILDAFEKAGITYVGIDQSRDQVEAAKEYLEGYKLTIKPGDICFYMSSYRYDILLATTVLSHIPPELVERALLNMDNLANNHMILVEPGLNMKGRLERTDDQWIHDYERILGALGWKLTERFTCYTDILKYMHFERVVPRK